MPANEWTVKDMAIQVLKLMHRKREAHDGTWIWRIFERERTWSRC